MAVSVGLALATAVAADAHHDAKKAAKRSEDEMRKAFDSSRNSVSAEDQARAAAEAASRRRASPASAGGQNSTALTGPLGLSGEPGGRRATILGA